MEKTKFNIGDIIIGQVDDFGKEKTKWEVVNIGKDVYTLLLVDCERPDITTIPIENQDSFELIEGNRKYDIKNFRPFDRVLVRADWHYPTPVWIATFYSHFVDSDNLKRHCVINGEYFRQCIPYDDNTKHLVGKTDECPDFYKTWN